MSHQALPLTHSLERRASLRALIKRDVSAQRRGFETLPSCTKAPVPGRWRSFLTPPLYWLTERSHDFCIHGLASLPKRSCGVLSPPRLRRGGGCACYGGPRNAQRRCLCNIHAQRGRLHVDSRVQAMERKNRQGEGKVTTRVREGMHLQTRQLSGQPAATKPSGVLPPVT
jgi:hypothetical protein